MRLRPFILAAMIVCGTMPLFLTGGTADNCHKDSLIKFKDCMKEKGLLVEIYKDDAFVVIEKNSRITGKDIFYPTRELVVTNDTKGKRTGENCSNDLADYDKIIFDKANRCMRVAGITSLAKTQ